MRVAIALGANLNDRLQTIQKAFSALQGDFLENARLSSVYETKPWGGIPQPDFMNAVVVGETEWKAPAIVNYLKTLEKDLGRRSRERNGPREIDLDLLLIEDQVYEGPGVSVPHPGIADRSFVLNPLKELWPEWVHPKLGLSVNEMLKRLNSAG